jgi:hypothetical protein
MHASARAVFRSTFAPRRLRDDEAGFRVVTRYGWVLIVVRWTYYSIVFQLRDYRGQWAPFIPSPFGMSVDAYAGLQRTLALPFGIGLMILLAASLVVYLRFTGTAARLPMTFNVLGSAFFLPFVLVQPIDLVLIALDAWRLVPVTVIHTAVLVWESWIALAVLSTRYPLNRACRLGGTLVTCGAWILVAGTFWR